MGDRLLVVMFAHKWATIGLIAALTLFVLSIKKFFDEVSDTLERAASARQQRAQLERSFDNMNELNRVVAAELEPLSEVARRRLLDRAEPGADRQVASAFERLDRLIDTFSKDLHQPWVRAIVDGYHVRVRELMARQEQKSESPEVLVDIRGEIHNSALADLKLRRSRDGRYLVRYPRDAQGQPFQLPWSA